MIFLALAASCASADFLDKYISFSEAEIQAAIDKSEERVGVAASMSISLAGGAPVPLDVSGIAGIRYDDKGKAFYLEKPVATSVRSPALSSDEANALRGAATQLIAAYFQSRPVYVLREDGNAQERAARWLLRAIRIEPGKVVATLSPF